MGGGGGEPPGGDAGLAGLGGVEADGVEGEVEGGGGAGDGAGGVEDELPLALIEEQAGGEPRAEERDEQGEGEGFEQPEGMDDLDGGGGGAREDGAFGGFWGGAVLWGGMGF